MNTDKPIAPPLVDTLEDSPSEDTVYDYLLREKGEEYARLYRAGREEVEKYVSWWQKHFNTENDEIKNLGLEPEYFSSLAEAKQFLLDLEDEAAPNIKVRNYRTEDLNEILSLLTATGQQINVLRYSKHFNSSHTRVAERNGSILAFGSLHNRNQIDCLYVHHEHQRKGTGTAVLTSLEQASREAGATLIFAEASITTREFFLARGFSEIKEQKVSLTNQCSSNFLMEKCLY